MIQAVLQSIRCPVTMQPNDRRISVSTGFCDLDFPLIIELAVLSTVVIRYRNRLIWLSLLKTKLKELRKFIVRYAKALSSSPPAINFTTRWVANAVAHLD